MKDEIDVPPYITSESSQYKYDTSLVGTYKRNKNLNTHQKHQVLDQADISGLCLPLDRSLRT